MDERIFALQAYTNLVLKLKSFSNLRSYLGLTVIVQMVYGRHLPLESHDIGKRITQRIERKPLNLRTRIKRLIPKTICFSKAGEMHDLGIGLFINRP
jgi:IS1 family transposase